MATLKEIRERIASVKSTRQITSAMKMVSAAKLKRAQDAIVQMRPYAGKLIQILSHISEALDTSEGNNFFEQREPNKVLLVMISANRGLCGGFNSNIAREVIQLTCTTYKHAWDQGNLEILLLGKKGGEILKSKGLGLWEHHNDLLEKPGYNKTETITDHLLGQFREGKYDRIDLIYNQFKNAASQVLVHEQFLPIELNADPSKESHPFYLFEPTLDYMMSVLIPKALKIQFFKAILDSQAAEHGARMTAMHQATDNATGLIRELNLEYNKARQADITRQLIEIISGAEALKS